MNDRVQTFIKKCSVMAAITVPKKHLFGFFIKYLLHWLHPMCNPLMCNIVPNVQHFFEQFVFCLVSPLCNTQEKFQLQNDKNERKWVEHGFQNDKIDL